MRGDDNDEDKLKVRGELSDFYRISKQEEVIGKK